MHTMDGAKNLGVPGRFQSPSNRVNIPNGLETRGYRQHVQRFQSPSNRVNIPNSAIRAAVTSRQARFQSPSNRVNIPNLLTGATAWLVVPPRVSIP